MKLHEAELFRMAHVLIIILIKTMSNYVCSRSFWLLTVFYLALLVFIVRCSSVGVFVFPAAPVSSLFPATVDPFAPVLTVLLLDPFPAAELLDGAVEEVVRSAGDELLEVSLATDFRVVLPGLDLPLVDAVVVSSVAFLFLVWAGDIPDGADATEFCTVLLMLSSAPLLVLLDAALVLEDGAAVADSAPADSILEVLFPPLAVGWAETVTVWFLSAAAAKAAVCWRADLLSLALLEAFVSWFVIAALVLCSLEGSSVVDFRVRLGLGDALDAGLDPLDVTSFCALDLAFLAAGELFGKL